jgi:hypothetical protein
MQDRGMQIGDMDFVFDDVEAHLVRRADRDAAFDAAAGHPHGEGLRMMIAAHAATKRDAGLDHRRAAKFTAPDDERVSSRPRCLRSLTSAALAWSVFLQLLRTLPSTLLCASQPSL